MNSIKTNLLQVQSRILSCAQRANREPASITLVAVSKTKPVEAIEEAFAAGQRDFGENYLQESLVKMDRLKGLGIVWHYIGVIQGNKTREIAERFTWVHTLDRLKIAQRLSRQRPPSLNPLDLCLQVNIDSEESKAGCRVDEVMELAQKVSELPNIRLRGLMTIPKPGSGVKPFTVLSELLDQVNGELGLGLDTLSMGMSEDMELAVSAGSTMVRVGTAIFGKRVSSL